MIETILKEPKLTAIIKTSGIESPVRREGHRNLAALVASDAVGWADALIRELKRPKDYKEMFGV